MLAGYLNRISSMKFSQGIVVIMMWTCSPPPAVTKIPDWWEIRHARPFRESLVCETGYHAHRAPSLPPRPSVFHRGDAETQRILGFSLRSLPSPRPQALV